MNLLRIVIPAVVLWLIWLWVKSKFVHRTNKTMAPERTKQCKHCGVYVPERDALQAGDNFYCSEEHRRADD